MTDCKIRFCDDFILYNDCKFSYTELLLQKHYKAIGFKARPFDTFSKEEIYNLIGVNLNSIEQIIVDYATVYEYSNLDEYMFSDFYYTASYDYLDEDFYISILDMAKSDHYMAIENSCDNSQTNWCASKDYIDFTRLIVDVVEYRAKKYDIYDMLCIDWQEDLSILEIVSQEYENNLYYNIIDENKIIKCLEYYHFYILENILYKDVIKKLKKKERKRLLNYLSCKNNIEKLKKYYNSKQRIYDTNKLLNKSDKSTYIKKQKTPEVCYIIKNKRNGLYKIGYSSKPLNREKTLQSEEPELESIKIFKNNHEKELHKIYSKQRIRGEWFDLTNLQVKYICTHFE